MTSFRSNISPKNWWGNMKRFELRLPDYASLIKFPYGLVIGIKRLDHVQHNGWTIIKQIANSEWLIRSPNNIRWRVGRWHVNSNSSDLYIIFTCYKKYNLNSDRYPIYVKVSEVVGQEYVYV